MIALLIDYEKQFNTIKLLNQELKTRLETAINRLDLEEKKVNDLTSENVNIKLSNQDLKSKQDTVNSRLDELLKKITDLTSDNAKFKQVNQ